MLFRQLLDEALIEPDLRAANRWEAIETLVDRLAASKCLAPAHRDGLLQAVNERERSLGTGLEKGVAIPHAFAAGLEGGCLVLGVSRTGIPFDAMDGEPARIVALLVAPATEEARKDHVQLLALLSHFFMDRETREALLEARTVGAVQEIIRRFLDRHDEGQRTP